MKKTMKNILFGFAIAVFAGACSAAVSTTNFETAKAETETVAITPTKTAGVAEFYMEEGAGVRVKANEAGIRFTATITEDYWNTLQESYGQTATYTFSSVLTANGKSQQKDFGSGSFTFEDGLKSFYTAVVYTDLTPEELAELTALEFSAQTYLTVANGTTTEVIAAYGETGSRSMEVVANAAWLDETGEHHQSTLLENYFTVGGSTEEVKGGFTADGGVLTADCVKDAQKVDVYYGTQKLAHTVTEDGVSFSGISTDGLTVGNELCLSVFADGKVYRSNAVYATALIKQDNIEMLLTATDGYYVLAEDIDLANVEWHPTATFKGTFNGLEHTVSNLKSSDTAKYSGLFYILEGATIENLAIVNHVSELAQYGVIAAQGKNNVRIENVFVDSDKTPETGTTAFCGLFRTYSASTIILKNVVVNIPEATGPAFGFIAGYGGNTSGGSTPVDLTNGHFIGGASRLGGTRSSYGGVKEVDGSTYYESLASYVVKDVTLPTEFLQAASKTYLESAVKKITQENVTDLLTATSGYYALAEDIDLVDVEWKPTATFTGTLDGTGHKISNLTKPNDDTVFTGLFHTLNGARIENLAIVNHGSENAQYGILAHKGQNKVKIENVFVDSNKTPGTGGSAFCGLFREYSASDITLTNVVVQIPETTGAAFGFIAGFGGNASGGSTTVDLTNCHFIGGANRLGGTRSGYGGVKEVDGSTYTFYADAEAFTSASVTLPEQVSAWAAEYVK